MIVLIAIFTTLLQAQVIGLIDNDPHTLQAPFVGFIELSDKTVTLTECPTLDPCQGPRIGLPVKDFQNRLSLSLAEVAKDRRKNFIWFRTQFRKKIDLGQLEVSVKERGDVLLQRMVEKIDQESPVESAFVEKILGYLNTPTIDERLAEIFVRDLEPWPFAVLTRTFRVRTTLRDGRGESETPELGENTKE
ncbi:MAG: hypothetical protein HYZ71_14000 [Deltaproteobacteria bacterium]|nr:hypothetical protein [Deltaproteobacteria bacterium]